MSNAKSPPPSGQNIVQGVEDGVKKTWNAANDPNEQQKAKDATNKSAASVNQVLHSEQNRKAVANGVNQVSGAFKKGLGSFGKKKK